jgi:GTP pyrophosphokinase
MRILLIRLADRLHNMRTLEYQTPEKQVFTARETLEVYAPLAGRLGINWMKVELEDLSFKYLRPHDYQELAEWVSKKKNEREEYTNEVKQIIRTELDRYGLKGTVEGRAKHFYSIYQKMKDQHLDFHEIYDLTAFRIILDSDKIKECYEVLSVVHSMWKPVPGRFKDYIAIPKANNYRSLHTTVIGPHGERVEIQIRTKEMHEWAEKGIAAHWRYKEGQAFPSEDEEQIRKLRELLEDQQEHKDAREFMRNLKLALYPEDVYVFTPTGDVRSFPRGATPVDFAYSIHTDIGNQCIGAKVNRNIVPLKYKLKNGDTVEIITQKGHYPSKDWLKYVVTSRAISKIKHWIKTEERERSVSLGREIFDRELKRHHLQFKRLVKTDKFKNVLNEHTLNDVDDMLALIGYGKLSAKQVVHHFITDEEKTEKTNLFKKVTDKIKKSASSDAEVSITGVDDIMVKFAKCCNPLPGDDIVGYITRGRGVSIHVYDCPKIQDMDAERIIDVKWNIEREHTHSVSIRVVCRDKRGLFADLSNVISALGINISYANLETSEDQFATCDFQIDVKDLSELNRMISGLRNLKNVISVDRVSNSFFRVKKKRFYEKAE